MPTHDLVIPGLAAFLAERKVMTLATMNSHGPHAVSLYFACDDRLNLYFVSHPDAAHCCHVRESPTVAATTFATTNMWQKVRGAQIRGQCRPIPAERSSLARALLIAKFPGMGEVETTVHTCQIYCITPSWIRWIDNSVRFGHKVELHWPWPPKVLFREHDGGII